MTWHGVIYVLKEKNHFSVENQSKVDKLYIIAMTQASNAFGLTQEFGIEMHLPRQIKKWLWVLLSPLRNRNPTF